MTKRKIYDWSLLTPPDQNEIGVRLTPKQEQRVTRCIAKLVALWGIDAETARQEILSVKIDYAVTQLYQVGNDKRIEAQKELSELHRWMKSDKFDFRVTIIDRNLKGKHSTKILETDYVRRKIYETLLNLQNPKIDKKGRGRPQGHTAIKSSEVYIVRNLDTRYTAIIPGVRERCHFIGMVMTAAGFLYNDSLEDQPEHLKDPWRDHFYDLLKKHLR